MFASLHGIRNLHNHLLLFDSLLKPGPLLVGIDVVSQSQVVQVALPVLVVLVDSQVGLEHHLIGQVGSHELSLLRNTVCLLLDHLLSLFWPKVRLEVLPIHLLDQILPILVHLHLLGQEGLVFIVVPLPQLDLMNRSHILFMLDPAELLSFKLASLFDPLTLLLESTVGICMTLLEVVDVLLSLLLSVVIELERTIAPHEVRIGLRMVAGRNLLTIQGETDDRSNVIVVGLGSRLGCDTCSLLLLPKDQVHLSGVFGSSRHSSEAGGSCMELIHIHHTFRSSGGLIVDLTVTIDLAVTSGLDLLGLVEATVQVVGSSNGLRLQSSAVAASDRVSGLHVGLRDLIRYRVCRFHLLLQLVQSFVHFDRASGSGEPVGKVSLGSVALDGRVGVGETVRIDHSRANRSRTSIVIRLFAHRHHKSVLEGLFIVKSALYIALALEELPSVGDLL